MVRLLLTWDVKEQNKQTEQLTIPLGRENITQIDKHDKDSRTKANILSIATYQSSLVDCQTRKDTMDILHKQDKHKTCTQNGSNNRL